MMDAKKALTEASGDAEAAKQILRERGLAKADSRAGRDSDQGAVAVARDSDAAAAVVELRCETDFSAKNEDFTALAAALAEAVLAGGPGAVEAHSAAIDDLRIKLKEHIEVGAVQLVRAADGNRLDVYRHVQDGRGVNAVVVEGRGVSPEDLHKVALHIAFARPRFLSVDEVPADEVERERGALTEITKKPRANPRKCWTRSSRADCGPGTASGSCSSRASTATRPRSKTASEGDRSSGSCKSWRAAEP